MLVLNFFGPRTATYIQVYLKEYVCAPGCQLILQSDVARPFSTILASLVQTRSGREPCTWYTQGASLRGRLRSLTRKNRNETRINGADREVHDFGCKLTTFKCQELHAPGKQPARRMHARNTPKEDGEKEQLLYLIEIGAKGK